MIAHNCKLLGVFSLPFKKKDNIYSAIKKNETLYIK